jgi:DNA-binding response OmpR family regulator
MEILILEDDESTSEFFSDLVISLGYDVETCTDAKSALEAYKKKFYPLIITDIGLPGMNGFEFCEKLRQLPRGDESAILVATGLVKPYEIRKALDAGADDYISKPIDVELLIIRLEVGERLAKERMARKQAEKSLKEALEKLEGSNLSNS